MEAKCTHNAEPMREEEGDKEEEGMGEARRRGPSSNSVTWCLNRHLHAAVGYAHSAWVLGFGLWAKAFGWLGRGLPTSSKTQGEGALP